MAEGFSPEQAKLKAVWENQKISSICSEMTNMAILQANVAAALNKSELSSESRQLMDKYANETGFGYCTGCSHLCESLIKESVPIGDIMRYLMYHFSYGNQKQAARLFNKIPGIDL